MNKRNRECVSAAANKTITALTEKFMSSKRLVAPRSLPGGSGTSGKAYSYIDTEPLPLSFYRSRKTEQNGTKRYSKVVKVKAGESGIYTIFPTRSLGLITVQSSTDKKIDKVQIFNASGLEMNAKAGITGQSMQYDISVYPAGIYFIRIYCDGQQFVERVIKY